MSDYWTDYTAPIYRRSGEDQFVAISDQQRKRMAVDLLLFEDCGTCDGSGEEVHFHGVDAPRCRTRHGAPQCPDCIDGRVLREGVWRRRMWDQSGVDAIYVIDASLVEGER